MSDKNLPVLSDVSSRAGKTYKRATGEFAIG
jgi:hypothetical protein